MLAFFLFGMYCEPEKYLWIFEKYADTARKCNGAVVFEEELFRTPNEIKDIKKVEEIFCPTYDFQISDLHQIEQLNRAVITIEEKRELFQDYNSEIEARKQLVRTHSTKFEAIIEKKLVEIESKGERIEAILTWIWNPSLSACAEKRKIPIINQELSAVRGIESYSEIFGYFCWENKYSTKQIKNGYEDFKKYVSELLVFGRRELLALLLKTENLDVLNRLNEPLYEFGIDIGIERDFFYQAYDGRKEEEVFSEFNKMIDPKQVLARAHPVYRHEVIDSQYVIDDSPNALEWILKCKRIVSVLSNVAFDAMLLGRSSYCVNEHMPYYYKNINDFSVIEDTVADIEYVNYVLFAYYVPWKLMFKSEYIQWRISGPDIVDIYRINFQCILAQYGMDYDELLKLSPLERFERILICKHKLQNEGIKVFTENVKKYTYNELEKGLVAREEKITVLEKEIIMLRNEMESLLNGACWKITAPLRYSMDFIKNRKQK